MQYDIDKYHEHNTLTIASWIEFLFVHTELFNRNRLSECYVYIDCWNTQLKVNDTKW